jgi:hypothetical protein
MENFSQKDSLKLEEIRKQADVRYGADAEFAYPTSDKQFAMLTLDDAIVICGQYISGANDNALWATLDKFYNVAEVIKKRGEALAESARSLGRASVERYQ